jgi:urease accessory protein
MSAAGFQSDPIALASAAALASIRAVAGVRASFVDRVGITQLADLSERGGYRLGLPSTFAPHAEAVQVNTGGGVIGGDRIEVEVSAGEDADITYTTQSAERVYRSLGPAAEIDVRLSVGRGGRMDWLPQQTILYSGARLKRRFEIDTASDSRLLMVEAITFGRGGSGEVMGQGLIHDVWRARRDGRLIYADAMRLDGDIARLLARPAVASGACASGILVYFAPDAEERLDAVRLALAGARCDHGASAWNGLLAARFLGGVPADVRAGVALAIELLAGRALPRVWTN